MLKQQCGCIIEPNTDYRLYDALDEYHGAHADDSSPFTVVMLCIDHDRQARRRTAIALLQREIDKGEAMRRIARLRDGYADVVDRMRHGASLSPIMDGDDAIGYTLATL